MKSNARKPAPTTSLLTSLVPVTVIAALVVVAGIAAMFLGLSFLWKMDYVDSAYANRSEAEANNLFGRGWMPTDMPTTMNNIRIRIDVDTNSSWATFVTDATGVEEIRSRYESVSGESLNPPGETWLSRWLGNPSIKESFQTVDPEYFTCGNQTESNYPAFLALDPETHRVYYWLR